MFGDFFEPLLAYLVTLLALTLGASAFHRLRVRRLRSMATTARVLALARRADCDEAETRRAA